MGFGPLPIEENEPVFHADWEKRALGMTLCCAALGYWSLDETRFSRESLRPKDYYGSTYYEIWIRGLINLLKTYEEISEEELRLGTVLAPGKAVGKRLQAADVAGVIRKGGPTQRETVDAPRFAVGDTVRTRNLHPAGHCRLPAYARDKIGVIEAVHGAHVFPDTNAHDHNEAPKWLYTLRFSASTLWGDDSDPNLTVSIEVWEPYLEEL